MAIVIGNKTASNQNPGGASQTRAHTQNTGSGGTLLVVITMASTVNFDFVEYGGVRMTLVKNQLYSGMSQRMGVYILQNPPTGNNNIFVDFSGSQWNSTSIFACSFTGAGSYGSFINSGGQATPNSQSITISANSIIYLHGVSVNAQTPFSINGVAPSYQFTANTNKQVGGALSNTGLSAGSTSVITNAGFGNITNFRLEILEAGGPPTPTRRRIILT